MKVSNILNVGRIFKAKINFFTFFICRFLTLLINDPIKQPASLFLYYFSFENMDDMDQSCPGPTRELHDDD